MPRHVLLTLLSFVIAMITAGPGSSTLAQTTSAEEALVKKARAIHEKVITLDTHIDFSPGDLVDKRNYTQRLETQFNLPNMIDGGLDALFFSIYVGQTREAQNPDAFKPAGYERAYKLAVEKFDAVHRFTREIAPDKIELALNAADVRRINARGKKVALIGVENGYPIGEDIARVKEFYDRGARYLSLTHNGHNQLAPQCHPSRWLKWNGSRPRQQVIAEMNRLDYGRRLARVQGVDDANRGAVEGAHHRLSLSRPRSLRRKPQHGRRAIAGTQENRRRIQAFAHKLRQDDEARFIRPCCGSHSGKERTQPARANRPANARASNQR
jgi:hypothetical protein